jgi:hypothetical protein
MRCSERLGIVLLVGASLAHAQQIRSATWSTDQFVLRYRTMVEPPRPSGQGVRIGGGGADDSTTQHRILTDSQQKKYFGYDLQVQPMGDGRFQLTFKPLTLSTANRNFFKLGTDWSELQMPTVPAMMQIKDGETVALDLLVNQSAGEKIVEYISVSGVSKTKSATPTNQPRDAQVSDIQMSLMSPRLHVNGKSAEWNRGDTHGVASGSVLWIYVADRGRFLVSLAPHPGFRQAGEVRGSSLKFSWNGDNYELETAGKIAPADAALNLYILQDTGYVPEGYPPTLYGGADKPEQLLKR